MTGYKDDGGPFHPPAFDSRDCPAVGASYRAWAAGIAMAAYISRGEDAQDRIARWAVSDADALIAELQK